MPGVTRETVQQIRSLCNRKGFFDVEVYDYTASHPKNAVAPITVWFDIDKYPDFVVTAKILSDIFRDELPAEIEVGFEESGDSWDDACRIRIS